MTAPRFDAFARFFIQRRDARRQAIPDTGTPPVAEWARDKTSYLFVQSFQSGSLAPTDDPDKYTLTLEAGLGQTVYFSDRPGRDVGIVPTPNFFSGLGFPEDNPPNAAFVVETGDGETELAVLELFDPVYDEATHTATYQVRGLEAWEDGLAAGLEQAAAGLDGIAPDFGVAHLLIDDCSDDTIECGYVDDRRLWNHVGYFNNQGFCYNFALCIPCEPYGHSNPDRCSVGHYWEQRCNDTFPACENNCDPSWFTRDLLCADWL